MIAIYHPEAEAEMIATASFYAARVPGLGAEFLDAIDSAVNEILCDPERYELLDGAIRRKPLRRFPHQIYYQQGGETIWILSIAHPARRPGYWRSREPGR